MSETIQEPHEVPEGYTEVQLGPKLEVIPSDWGIESLSNWLSSLETGGRPKTSKRSESDSVLSIGGTHISDGSFDLDNPVYISEAYYEELNSGKIEEGDILLVKDGATIGKSTYVNKVPEGRAAINSHVYILRVNHKRYDPQFLYNFIKSRTGLDQILRLTTGTAQAGLNRTFQQATKVPTPSVLEQRRIADILSTVDKQIQQTDDIIEAKQDLIQGLINELVKTGIQDSPDIREVQIGPKQVEIPTNWDLLRVDELVADDDDAIRTGPFGSKLKKEYLVSEGVKVYEQRNVYDNDFTQGNRYVTQDRYESELTSYDANPGDVLITLQGTIGDAAVLPDNAETGVINQKLMRVRVDPELCSPEYFATFFDESHLADFQIKAVSHGAVVSGLNISTISGIRVPLPSLHEQRKIADIVESSKSSLAEEQEYKQNIQELKRGLMQDLLTGKVRVNTD